MTNIIGKEFEDKTSLEKDLLSKGFTKKLIENCKNKCGYYLEKEYNDIKIIYLLQKGLQLYIKKYHNIEIFRNPDEAFIIYKGKSHGSDKINIKIIEKKAQTVEGSVETCLIF